MEKYDPAQIEPKWQKIWEEQGIYKTPEPTLKNPKLYCLSMFPYPSGDGLHVGHARIYTASDVLARYFRAKGYSVLHPMGWDAFGLPAENDAIRNKENPNDRVPRNIINFKNQMKMLAFSYNWGREFATCDPSYYKWTQWLFLKLYEKGLVYQTIIPINWCPSCKTGLADEEAVGGKCDRCGATITKKDMKQWLLRITAYADSLLDDLNGLDWPEGIVKMEQDWIGRSEGVEIRFPIGVTPVKGLPLKEIPVFTTRPDTLFGVTFFVLAPEHPILKNSRKKEVLDYIEVSKQKSELDRIADIKNKTGVFTGLHVYNPLSGEKIPVWVADFVLMSYGTGAVMGVPGHDQRDWDFAKKYGFEIREVISGGDVEKGAYMGEGRLVNSGKYNGLHSAEAIAKITEDLTGRGLGKKTVQYHLRDWVFSRQRYWGEPFPLVHCEKCGVVPVPYEDLPVELPYLESYEPTGTGESPLASVSGWVNTNCPGCGGRAKRETDTMPNWAGSCWYFLRFADPENDRLPFSDEATRRWLPVDWYLGGAEHAVLHLLYARFWVKVFYDLGFLRFKEPFLRLRGVGMVLAEDGRKMSKSWHNVVNPDEVVKDFGADTLRLYEMFMGPWEQAMSWNPRGVEGCYRFLNRVWKLVNAKCEIQNSKTKKALHRLVKKVGEDIEAFKFNTAIAAMMGFLNEVQIRINTDPPEADKADYHGLSMEDWGVFLRLLAPFAPHITEELWQRLFRVNPRFGSRKSAFISIHQQPWPQYDPRLLEEEEVTIVVQIDGKVREKLKVQSAISNQQSAISKLAQDSGKTQKYLTGKKIKDIIFVPGRLINFVTK